LVALIDDRKFTLGPISSLSTLSRYYIIPLSHDDKEKDNRASKQAFDLKYFGKKLAA
jgi:hypothetical protein